MIILKSQAEIEKIRKSNKLVTETLSILKENIREGISTLKLNKIAETYLKKKGALPAFKNYRGYPATLCTSLNEEVVHGIPSAEKTLKKGDLVSLDLGAYYEGYYGDAAISLTVGEVPQEVKQLLKVTEDVLYIGIAQSKPGNYLSNISFAIQQYVESFNFSVVRDYVGHGIGLSLHEEPEVPNFGKPGQGPKLKKGMVFTIEPMVNIGRSKVKLLDDHWTAVTVDHSLSAHFEHTIAITDGEADILSKLS